MSNGAYFSDLLHSIADRGRALLGRSRTGTEGSPGDLGALCDALLSRRGEASGVALAREVLTRYATLDDDGKRDFLTLLAERYGPDRARLEKAMEAYRVRGDDAAAMELHMAAEPRRQELIRRLNLAPGGTARLVQMRADALRLQASIAAFPALDADFQHLFSSWFNRGFLVLRPICWTTPANILQKIIEYEAVHEIRDWNDLRRRIEPPDRRCFAFFHPQLVDDPLIFVEVALSSDIPGSIADVLAENRRPITAERARTAGFYSISNCQEGLRGISFGNFLIKQVVEELSRELPGLDTFVTLSPVPGFAQWLARERSGALFSDDEREALEMLDNPGWHANPEWAQAVRPVLLSAAAHYFLRARSRNGKPVDPVARFHLGNGARLERINWLGDLSPKGLQQAHGLMVNYLYDLKHIERNHEAFVEDGMVVASNGVRRLLRTDTTSNELAPAES
jgi:malonyl-CoA decarboxylase